MPTERVTLKDIAEQIGVHPSTVSRVLNPATRDMVSQDVIERVTTTARSLGYRPNPLARGLKTQSSGNIGVFVPDLTNPMFPEIVRGAEAVLVDAGYTPILANTKNDRERKLMLVDHLKQRQIDGIIIITALRNDPIIATCRENAIPVVVSDRGIGETELPGLIIDDQYGMRSVVSHLVAFGHRRIALISGPQQLSPSISRHSAALKAFHERNIEVDSNLITFCNDFSREAGHRACRTLLDRDRSFTAIITLSDIYAIGAIAELRDQGLSCPGDISVTGYNGIRPTKWLSPSITTVDLPKREMGRRMAEIMLHRLKNPAGEVERIVIRPTLIERESSGPVRHG
ncbi:MAG: LacI family DNA-binding transcriptional regulator [Proteobacteria bacterium]|nr:LacI family DNA-binding transcriptional regulator [Pseudomonadota bacterium]